MISCKNIWLLPYLCFAVLLLIGSCSGLAVHEYNRYIKKQCANQLKKQYSDGYSAGLKAGKSATKKEVGDAWLKGYLKGLSEF